MPGIVKAGDVPALDDEAVRARGFDFFAARFELAAACLAAVLVAI